MIERDEGDQDQDESTEEKKMTETILQRLQFTLLSLVKSGGVVGVSKNWKKVGDRKTPVEGATYKELYGETLKCSSASPGFIKNLHSLLLRVRAERGKLN